MGSLFSPSQKRLCLKIIQIQNVVENIAFTPHFPAKNHPTPQGGLARTCNWNPHLRAVCQNSPLGHACFTSGGSGGCEGMVLLLWQFLVGFPRV